MTDLDTVIRDKYGGKKPSGDTLGADMQRLAAGEPLAYVIGWMPFLGLRIYLDSKPFIPRPETEWWTEELVKFIGEKSVSVLDLCAGSGAIGCAILKHCPNARVSLGEFNPAHEATIRKNLGFVNPDLNPDVRIGDLFEPFAGEKFDIIAANPPYIPAGRKLDASVTKYEPPEALLAGKDGLAIIRRIAREAPKHLNPGGLPRAKSRGELWMECDIENIEAARRLVLKHANRADIRIDPYSRPRLVVGYY